MLALPRVAEGGRVIGVEPNTMVGGLLVDVLGPALADRPPMPSLDLRPLDLDGGVGLQNRAVVGMRERPGRAPLLKTKPAQSPSVSRPSRNLPLPLLGLPFSLPPLGGISPGRKSLGSLVSVPLEPAGKKRRVGLSNSSHGCLLRFIWLPRSRPRSWLCLRHIGRRFEGSFPPPKLTATMWSIVSATLVQPGRRRWAWPPGSSGGTPCSSCSRTARGARCPRTSGLALAPTAARRPRRKQGLGGIGESLHHSSLPQNSRVEQPQATPLRAGSPHRSRPLGAMKIGPVTGPSLCGNPRM
jgi:hypothetical protein